MKYSIILVVISLLFSPTSIVFGYIEFNDGGDYDIDYQIDTEVWIDFDHPGVHTTLNFIDGGSMNTDRDLYIYEDGRVNIAGGNINGSLSAHGRSQVLASGGKIGRYLNVYDMSQATLSGGSISYYLLTNGSSEVILDGASVGQGLVARDDSTIHIFDGSAGSVQFQIYNNSHIYLSGGRTSSTFLISQDGILTIDGSNFTVDEQPVGYGEITSLFGGSRSEEPFRNLKGTLLDGESLNNPFFIGENGKIILVPPPTNTLTVGVDPNDVGINTVEPAVGEHRREGWVNIEASQFLSCPDVYQFHHWDGDVSDTASDSTTVLLDSDKTVVAVFVPTRECGDDCHHFPIMDFNEDCIVDFGDLALFAISWLDCTKPECD